jgi:hypothetical protein
LPGEVQELSEALGKARLIARVMAERAEAAGDKTGAWWWCKIANDVGCVSEEVWCNHAPNPRAVRRKR